MYICMLVINANGDRNTQEQQIKQHPFTPSDNGRGGNCESQSRT